MHLHTTQGHKDDCNKLNMSSNEVREPIHERSKPSNDKIFRHNSSIYYSNHLLFFSILYLILCLNFRLFISFFDKDFRLHQQKLFYVSQIYFCYFSRYNYDEMAEITYPHFVQYYSKYIFKK